MVSSEEWETEPVALQDLANAGFRAVHVIAGATISAALGSDGTVRAWGQFRVRSDHET